LKNIKVPDDCNPHVPWKFYVTPRVALHNGHEYCEGDGPYGQENNFRNWVCLVLRLFNVNIL